VTKIGNFDLCVCSASFNSKLDDFPAPHLQQLHRRNFKMRQNIHEQRRIHELTHNLDMLKSMPFIAIPHGLWHVRSSSARCK
jgi:hypothetical protein